MDIRFSAFDHAYQPGGYATHLLTGPGGRLLLSLVVTGASLPPPRFALKDSDPLWAEARVESYAAATRLDLPSGASN